MTKYFKAECGTGLALRSSASRTYSHAIMTRDEDHAFGFCGRLDLAQKAQAQWNRPGRPVEIAEAVEISRQEYTALKKAQK